MLYFGNGFLREESKTKPMFLGWIMDNWFGQDPGGGDVKDAAASATTLLTDEMREVMADLKSYWNTSIKSITDYTNIAANEYRNNINQGMSEAQAYFNAGLKASNEMSQRAIDTTNRGAEAAGKYFQQGYQQAIKGMEEYASKAPEFQYDAQAYRNDPNYQYGRQEIVDRLTNEAARMGVEDQADLQRLINRELANYDSNFRQQYLSEQSQVFGNQLQGYQAGLGAQQQLGALQAGQGAGMANIATQQAQGLGNIFLNQGQSALGVAGQQGQAALQGYSNLGQSLGSLYGNLGSNLANLQMGTGTNLANIGKTLAEQRAGNSLSSNLQAIGLEKQQQAAGNQLLGQGLGYVLGMPQTQQYLGQKWFGL